MLPRVRFERFVDSHTEGEPTRVLLSSSGGPFAQTLDEVLARWTIDGVLTIPPEVLALAAHPRAADATVCALLCTPSKATAHCGVLFWNASAALGMCGHATIGLARTLASIDPKFPSHALFETRVGDVTIERRADGRIAFANIESWLHA
jgi:4-hydroxyproline epimerase